jgi:nicotinamide riboside transporter PnuC
LGIGSTMAFGVVFSTIQQWDGLGIEEWLLVIVIGVQMVLLHASAGAMIGTGTARGEVRGYFAQAGLLHIGYNLLMAIPLNFDSVYLRWIGIILATLLVVYYYAQVHRHLLPAVVKDALKAMDKAKG